MMEFSGELSDECKLYLLKDLTKASCFAAIITALIISIPIVIIAIFWDTLIYLFLIIPILLFIMMAHPKINPQTKTLSMNIPNKIIIEEGKIERDGDGERNYANREITAVKKVIDMGEWYHIVFYFGYKDIFFIFQKNLIVKGTIEEFEKLFKDKIVSK